MKSFAAVLVLCGMALVVYLRYRLTKSQPSDDQAIDDLMKVRGLRKVAVTRSDNYWRYWIRGKLSLSNCARIYVVVGEEPDGREREIHVAFDDWSLRRGELQVLLELEMPPQKGRQYYGGSGAFYESTDVKPD